MFGLSRKTLSYIGIVAAAYCWFVSGDSNSAIFFAAATAVWFLIGHFEDRLDSKFDDVYREIDRQDDRRENSLNETRRELENSDAQIWRHIETLEDN